MKTSIRILIILTVAVAAAAAFVLNSKKTATRSDAPNSIVTTGTNQSQSTPVAAAKLPRLLDLGADKCVPCRMMFPVLDDLKKEYAGRLNVEFIDVWKIPDAAKAYGVTVIPTQIFFNADGKELFRHEGFFAKADILAKWKELGVSFTENR